MGHLRAIVAICVLAPCASVWAQSETGLEEAGVETAQTPRFAVVTGRGRGAPNLRGQMKRRVEKKLKVFGEAVPFPQFRRAARRSGIKPREFADVATARSVGPELGLTHVVTVQSVRERETVGRRKKNVFYAEVAVIEVASGDVVSTQRFQLAGRRINAAVADEMVTAIGAELKLPEPPPPEEPPAVIPPPPPPEEPEVPEEPEPIEEPPPEPEPEPVFEDPGLVDDFEEPPPKRKNRPGLILLVGATSLQRDGSVSADNVAEDVTYEGPLLGGSVELGLFPLAFDGDGEFIEGLGIYARGSYFPEVTTEFDPNDDERTVDSNVGGGEGGLALRVPFGDSLEDPELMVVLGYAYWQFPLSDGVFPGAKYQGPYGQLTFNYPFTEQLSLFLDGGAVVPLDTDGRTKRLGELDSGFGFNGNLGVKLWFEPFDVRLVGHFRQYGASYTGTSRLGLVEEVIDADLTDRYFGGSLMLGVSL